MTRTQKLKQAMIKNILWEAQKQKLELDQQKLDKMNVPALRDLSTVIRSQRGA